MTSVDLSARFSAGLVGVAENGETRYGFDPFPELVDGLHHLGGDLGLHGEDVVEFVLVRNQGACCFGVVPRMNEWIHVTMAPETTAPYAVDIPITVFGVAMALERNPAVVAAMQSANWEIASHGYRWVDYQHVDEATERAHMAKAVEIHEQVTGERPSGWYLGRCSPNSHRLVAEVIDELEIRGRMVGIAPVGCAVLSYNYFNFDFQEAAHGRAPAMATGIKRVRPDLTVFTYQGDGDLASIGMGETVHAAARGETGRAAVVGDLGTPEGHRPLAVARGVAGVLAGRDETLRGRPEGPR